MKTKIIIFAIIALALFFRFYHLSSIPPRPSLDEVSIGYNAYSILKTGADEYGTQFPVLLQAYDDWRPALYVYLVIPFVKLFGLNVLAVRLPSALLSILTVLITYFLVKELFPNPKKLSILNFQLPTGEIAAFLLAISPWHIYISRLGHEVNSGLSFFVIGLFFFFKYINSRKQVFLPLSTAFFALSFSSYQSSKVFIPLIVVVLFGLFAKKLLSNRKILLISIIVGFIISLPIVLESFKPNALVRYQATNIFAANPQILDESAKSIIQDKKSGNYLGMLIHNRRVAYSLLVANAYLSHLNPVWLAANSGNEPFKIPSFGLLYVFEPLLFLIGTFFIIKSKQIQFHIKVFLFAWFFISIIPGAITSGYPHAMRIFNVLPLPQIFIAFGFFGIVSILNSQSIKKVMMFGIVGLYLFFAIWFTRSYFFEFPKKLSYQFQYGVKDALFYAKEHESEYDRIFVSNKNTLYQSYMFYLFFTEYDPILYQKNGGTKSGGFAEEHRIGKYEFGLISRGKIQNKALFILNPKELNGKNMQLLRKIKFLDGKDAVWIAKT